MFTPSDEAYLLRQLSRANLVLFLGAGFSTLARNRVGAPLPAGNDLAAQLWDLLSTDASYDGEPLDEVYQAILASGVGYDTIQNRLEERLIATEIPEEYKSITIPFWYRIYTTNIDNVVERTFSTATDARLEILSFPGSDLSDRDQLLGRVQLICLNGRLPCRPDEITFSSYQYGRAAAKHQPLYEQFVRDYVNHPVLFIGTRFNEPLVWQYLAVREFRSRGVSEQRPKSFLVSRTISPTKEIQLQQLNIVGVEASVDQFLAWLLEFCSSLPDKLGTLRLANPGLAQLLADSEISKEQIEAFAVAFTPVPTERSTAGDRSLYLLGAAPRWEDLFQDLDAPRELTDQLFSEIEGYGSEESSVRIMAILGSAGCGKSTVLRRLGIRLVQAGLRVYLTNSEELPPPEAIRRALETVSQRTVLLFDNAEVALSQLAGVVEAIKEMDYPPLLVIASRTNDFDRLTRKLRRVIAIEEFPVPHLVRHEIEAVINTLERNALLGELTGLTQNARVAAFEQRAHRQILVAMKEATTGRGFDVIIRDEFARLEPREAQYLYLCTALATDSGYRLSKEEFVSCATASPAEALHILARSLRDIVVPTGVNGSLLLLRHRLIAEIVIEQFAPRPLLREAYIRLLRALAPGVKGRHWRSRNHQFYKAIVNHKTIYRRFAKDIEEARSIYLAVAEHYGQEAHFWLQFGSLELEGAGGDLEYAENYLRAASSLSPGDAYIENAIGHLLLRKAREASDYSEAVTLRDQGSEILLTRIEETQYSDDYAVHILCTQRYRWSKIHHYSRPGAHREELEWIRTIANRGFQGSPLSRRLRRLRDLIERAYLETVVADVDEGRS